MKGNPLLISNIGELALVEKIREYFPADDDNVVVSIGDDAAVFRPRGDHIMVTTDLMTEGVHFDYSFVTPYQVGFKLISSNVSDIYAMGGIPSYAFLSIAMMNTKTLEDFEYFLRGVKDSCELYDVSVIGGDVSSSKRGDFFSSSLTGFGDTVIKRSGAKPGEKVYVTGTLGDSSAGLAFLKERKAPVPLERDTKVTESGLDPSIFRAVKRHLLPEAHDPGKMIGSISAMIDTSDGLLIDLYRLGKENGLGIDIYREKIPVSDEVTALGVLLGKDISEFVLRGGEDYQLLFTSEYDKIKGSFLIGEVTRRGFYIVDETGKKEAFGPDGYRHFQV